MNEQVEIIRNPYLESTELSSNTKLRVWGDVHTIESLRIPIEDTVYWRRLLNLDPRFSSVYQGYIGTEQFASIVGSDVIPWEHGPYQAETIAVPLLEHQSAASDLPQFPESLKETFIAYHVLHDDHEGEEAALRNSRTDIQFLQKTAEGEDAEFELWSKIHRELFGDNADAEITKIKQIIRHKYWKIGERLGYYATALQFNFAAQYNKNLTDKARRRLLLRGASISADHRTFLEPHRADVAYCDLVLGKTTDVYARLQRWRESNE